MPPIILGAQDQRNLVPYTEIPGQFEMEPVRNLRDSPRRFQAALADDRKPPTMHPRGYVLERKRLSLSGVSSTALTVGI
jgi:hypothetical protein